MSKKTKNICIAAGSIIIAAVVGFVIVRSLYFSGEHLDLPIRISPHLARLDVQGVYELAQQGDAEAQCLLGYRLYYGRGVPRDYTASAQWLRLAAEQGDVQAQYQLGLCYLVGVGVPRNKEEGIRWYGQAGRGGHAGVSFLLERLAEVMQTDADLTDPDPTCYYDPRRDTIYVGPGSTAVSMGHAFGQWQHYKTDFVEMINNLRKAAERGDVKAQFELGIDYCEGRSIPPDEAEGMKWLHKAAEQGYEPAIELLQGIAEINNLRKAAERGDADAQRELGMLYLDGLGVPQDYAEAVKWFRMAAEQGHAEGQYHLGVCCRWGQGVPQDHAEAVKWMTKAAEQGYPVAQTNLYIYYNNGIGVPQDREQAMEWLSQAVAQGEMRAQCMLGELHLRGDGVPQDTEEAVYWLRKSAEQGYEAAMDQLRKIEEK